MCTLEVSISYAYLQINHKWIDLFDTENLPKLQLQNDLTPGSW